MELCRKNRTGKFVLASSSSLYGGSNPVPFREDANTDYPLSPYAASKKGAEAMCYTYHHLYGIDVTIFRYFTVYGPAGRPDMSLFRFVQWVSEERPLVLYGDGKQTRDFTYVDDIADGTVRGLKPMGFEVVNLGGDSPHDLLELIALVEAEAGKKALIETRPMHAADVLATWADISKAERLLDWRPQVSLAEGVARLSAWYRENRDWAKDVVTEDWPRTRDNRWATPPGFARRSWRHRASHPGILRRDGRPDRTSWRRYDTGAARGRLSVVRPRAYLAPRAWRRRPLFGAAG